MSDSMSVANRNAFLLLIIVLLLIILGIVSFHYYTFVSASNGLTAGMGGAISFFPRERRRRMRHPQEEMMY